MNRKTVSLLLAVIVSLFQSVALQAAPKPEAAPSLAYLSKRVGESPYTVLKTQPLRRRLMALLGPEFPSFIDNLDPATDLAEQNGILHIEGNAPHRGGEEEAVILVDVPNDTLEVFIRHKTTIVKAWAENKRSVVIPHDVMGVMKGWPRPALAEALAGIVQASRAAGNSPTPSSAPEAPPATRVSTPVRTPSLCQPATACDETTSFAATITDFRTSVADRYRVITSTVRITNKLDHPLILGLVKDGAVGIDDQGNRYTVYSDRNVSGIGIIASTADTKFTLQPGESSDARIELVLQQGSNIIYGTSWEVGLVLREIDPVGAGGQFRFGKEHSLRFPGLVNRLAGMHPAPSPQAGVSPNQPSNAQPVPAQPSGPDPCAGNPRCYNAGIYTATIAQMTSSQLGDFKDHLLRMDIRFKNISDRPIILGYKAATSSIIDNLGNYYYWGHAGSHDGSVQGIGLVESQRADPSFMLQPGETRNATFQVIRYRPGNAQLGTSFTYSVTIDQLEILPSQQIRTGREFSMNFPDLRPNGLPSIGGLFRKK